MGERIKQYRIISNGNLADQVYEMELEGDSSWITHPGQFLNVTIDNAYLKRPISICDWNENGLTIIYKVVGFGTKQMLSLIHIYPRRDYAHQPAGSDCRGPAD